MIPNPVLDQFASLWEDGAWGVLSVILRVGVFAGLVILLVRLSLLARKGPSGKAKGFRVPFLFRAVCLVFIVALLVRQAGWQVLGARNEPFVVFMQRYDRREFNPAHRIRAGRILDRNGRTLALSQVTERGIQRLYPFGPIFSHAVGYNHPVYGLTGLEASSRPLLLGEEEDWMDRGRGLLDRETYAEGPALYTSLDLGLQRTAYDLMNGKRGSVILMDVDSGAIRVLVSRPAFDPNRLGSGWFEGRFADAPLVHRALQGSYPPGSVWKVLVAAAALQEGVTPVLDTPPEGYTNSEANPPIRDHEYYAAEEQGRRWRGRGTIGLREALVHSSNVYFAQLGVELGPVPLERAMTAVGLQDPLQLTARAEPSLISPAVKGADLQNSGDYLRAQFSIGQGDLLVNPLQVTQIMAAVANRGLVVKPTLRLGEPPRMLGRLCSAEAADALKWMLHGVVQEGTGQGIRMPDLSVAGKTGTAQTGGDRPAHSWFAGFAPVSQPRWAFCVLVEEGGYGSQTALPIARELLETGLREGWLTP